jgi:RNA polymerase sigma-70 factor (ECF subfamily)
MSGDATLARYRYVDHQRRGAMEAIPGLASESAERSGIDPAEELALRARTDVEAFGELYRRHRDAVFRFLRARCRDDQLALELTAVTFEKALGSFGRYRTEGGGVLAWLLRIGRNAAADYERGQRPLVRQWRLDSHRPTSEPSPEEALVRSDERRRLRLLVADLPEVQRDALALRFGAGLTARQIGVVIGKNEEATQKLIGRALARLREVVHDQF